MHLCLDSRLWNQNNFEEMERIHKIKSMLRLLNFLKQEDEKEEVDELHIWIKDLRLLPNMKPSDQTIY